MNPLQKLREQHAAAVKAAEGLLALDAPTDEQQAELEGHLALAETTQKQILTHERAGNVKTFASRSNGTPPAHAPLAPVEEEKPNTGYHLTAPPRGIKSQCFESNDDAHLCGLWALGMLFGDPANQQASRKARQVREWCLENAELFTLGQTEFDDARGGQFVPIQMEAAIDHLRIQYGVIRNEANVVPATSDTIQWPRPLKGVTVHALAEVTPTPMTTESTGVGDSFEMSIKAWGGWARISRDLEEDATVSIADMLVRDFAYAMAYKEDQVCFNGTGLSTDGGIEGIMTKLQGASYTASVATALSGNNTFATLDAVDFEAAIGQQPNFGRRVNNKWYMSKAAYYASAARLMDAAGGNNMSDLARGSGPVWLGHPVVFTEVLNNTLGANGSAYVALFGDLSLAATFGNRRGLTVETDYSIYRHNRQLAIFVTSRWGFVAHDLGGTDGAGNAVAGPVIAIRLAS